jgi:tetratricopeptide (TPR) repeat protein
MVKIAAILIVKGSDDEAAHLKCCLENIKYHVDGIFINVNTKPGHKPSKKVMRTARTYTDDIITTEWHDNFAEARNVNLAQVPADYDWVIWLDTDDTVDKPALVRKVAEASQLYDSVYVDYEYDHDDQGNVTTVHMVARLFKNNGSHQWNPKTRIHETLIETRGVSQGMTKDFKIIHHAEQERTVRSFERNIRMLEAQVEDEANDPDPRTFYYLACTYMDAGNLETAKTLFGEYLQLSGWDQERSVALTKLGRIYHDEGDTTEARNCFARAIAEDPNSPEPRVELGSLEIELNNWNKARVHLEAIEGLETNQTTLERNPMTTTFRTYLLLAECYLNMGGKWLDKAVEYATKAQKYKKKDRQVRAYVKMVKNVVADKNLAEHVLHVYKALNKNKEADKMDRLLEAVPKQLDDNPVFVKLRQKQSFKWPEKSIVIMTGDTAIDAWGPWSLAEGIGGSEEAIIRLAPKLSQMGYRVVIFGKPGHRAGLDEETGVMWRNYWECNLDDEFDIFIAWRAPFIFDKAIKAHKSYLWMHDVMEPGEFTPTRIANFTKCILLSDYHRSLFPMIPDDKVLMSGNGIDPIDFEFAESFASSAGVEGFDVVYDDPPQRDPHKIFYGSSHVRGLAYLYEIWPEVKAAVPEATLDVFYGRESYDKIHRGNPERMRWMDDMIAKAKELEGVTDHGKVGQDEIVQHMFQSGVWAYPCPFPEIYCITAIKAQAAGCVPVSTNFAALDETVQFGTKISIPNDNGVGRADQDFLDHFKRSLIWWLQHPDEQEKIRKDMMLWAREKSWLAIAEQWNGEFNA